MSLTGRIPAEDYHKAFFDSLRAMAVPLANRADMVLVPKGYDHSMLHLKEIHWRYRDLGDKLELYVPRHELELVTVTYCTRSLDGVRIEYYFELQNLGRVFHRIGVTGADAKQLGPYSQARPIKEGTV